MSNMKRISVIGAGNWGTALAVVAARAGHEVILWSRNDDVVKSIKDKRFNARYLSSTQIPHGVSATNDIHEALQYSSLMLLATPSHAVRALLTAMKPAVNEASTIVLSLIH